MEEEVGIIFNDAAGGAVLFADVSREPCSPFSHGYSPPDESPSEDLDKRG